MLPLDKRHHSNVQKGLFLLTSVHEQDLSTQMALKKNSKNILRRQEHPLAGLYAQDKTERKRTATGLSS